MEPYKPNVSISTLLALVRGWIKVPAQRRQEEEFARIAAKVVAKNDGTAKPELSQNEFNLLYKEFKNENPRVRSDDWISNFKKEFENMQMHEKIEREQKTLKQRFGQKKGKPDCVQNL